MLRADELNRNQINVEGKWVTAKPLKQSLPRRIRDAIQVLKGKAEAVSFTDQ